MGNIISNDSNNLIENTQLQKIITDWALNNYDAGLNYNNNNPNKQIKNLLKKRACCSNTSTMVIALPYFDIDDPNNIQVTEGYTPVNIKVFNDPPNKNLCVISDEISALQINPQDGSLSKPSYYQPIVDKTNNKAANNLCSVIYTSAGITGTTGYNLCNLIKKERQLNYPTDPQASAYGYYASQSIITDLNPSDQSSTLEKYNNYTDCNCINSVLRDNLKLPNNIESIVQSNDRYCIDCRTEGKCYIRSDEGVQSICINYIDVKEIIAEDNSNIIFNQNCNINPSSGSTSGSSTSSTTVKYIIFSSIFVVALLAGLIASGLIIL